MRDSEDIRTIEAYLNGQLSDDDRVVVIDRIHSDQHFRSLHDDVRLMIEGLKRSGQVSGKAEKLLRLRNSLHLEDTNNIGESEVSAWEQPSGKSIHEATSHKTSKAISIQLWKPAYVAASVLLLLAVTYFVFRPFSTISNEELFSQYYSILENEVIPATRGDHGVVTLRQQAYAAYDQRDFAECARLFESIMIDNPSRMIDLVYLGNAYLNIERWNDAVSSFRPVAESESSFADDAKWYLALSYLMTGESDQARQYFIAVRDEAQRRSNKAQGALKRMQ
ncbi:MAG: hypothetical protein OEQ53_06415 [Saprospiraceae bacterium]|nr:hypothetical protein [Saprospiraceae bacterium]